MAIDYYDLPSLHWKETRPTGATTHVICFISGADNGDLLFACNGGLLPDPIYRRRPWEKLMGFKIVPAVDLYYSGLEKRMKHEFTKNWAALRILAPDDATVITAEFADDHPSIPMHLNYGLGNTGRNHGRA